MRNMVIKVHTGFLQGLEGIPVDVEVSTARGLPAFYMVGLADTAVQEARKRVEGAIVHSGYGFPSTKLTVNLAPASIAKRGTLFDLPIAIGILATTASWEKSLQQFCIFGELSLDGRIRGIPGMLGLVDFARGHGYKGIIFPKEHIQELRWVTDIALYPVETLQEAVACVAGKTKALTGSSVQEILEDSEEEGPVSLMHIRGHEIAKRALTIAAAGGHNVLLVGPPGTGKSLLARAWQSLLPPLTFEEALEVTKIHSLARVLGEEEGLVRRRPFRHIHPTISPAGLIGGGTTGLPGELSLAHRGVLYIDELGEFPKHILELLRQPLEERRVTIARAHAKVVYPASVQLIATTNPCACGFLGHPRKPCICTPHRVKQYQQKFSGPLLDRCDMVLQIDKQQLTTNEVHIIPIKKLRTSVIQARAKQYERQQKLNADLEAQDMDTHGTLSVQLAAKLELWLDGVDGSARMYHRICKVARTIADMEGVEEIQEAHVQEALRYKSVFVNVQTNRRSG